LADWLKNDHLSIIYAFQQLFITFTIFSAILPLHVPLFQRLLVA